MVDSLPPVGRTTTAEVFDRKLTCRYLSVGEWIVAYRQLTSADLDSKDPATQLEAFARMVQSALAASETTKAEDLTVPELLEATWAVLRASRVSWAQKNASASPSPSASASCVTGPAPTACAVPAQSIRAESCASTAMATDAANAPNVAGSR